MISRISMENFGVYHGKTELFPCKKINLIYGNNGTGKTILSNYLADPSQPEYRDFSISWDDNKPLPVFVFNKKFCDENFAGTDIPGIFTLGRENTAAESRTDAINNRIKSQKQALEMLQNEHELLNRQKKELQNVCISAIWDRSKIYKQLLPNYFPKSYTKAQFFEKVLHDSGGENYSVPDILELKQRADVLNSQKETRYAFYPPFDESEPLSIEEDPVWGETPESEPETDPVPDDLNRIPAEWLREGVLYLGADHVCPFCGQEILSEEVSERISHLSCDDQIRKTELCGSLLSRYETIAERILSAADRILKQNRDEGAAFLDTGRFSDTVTNLRNLFHANILFMQRKRDSFLQQVHIQNSARMITALNRLIAESNEQAERANFLLEDLLRSKGSLKRDAWNSFCEKSENDLLQYRNAASPVDRRLKEISTEMIKTSAAIRTLEGEKEKILRSSVNIRESVDRINSELRSMKTGFFYLKVSEDEKHYNVMRGNGETAAETLSEGEKTLIMLLYFLQMADGAPEERNVRTERIIVIDDPVSNLDDNMLNAVLEKIGALITRILDGDPYIRQLFLLTHRKECTKKLRVCDRRLEDGKDLGLWILRKNEGTSKAQMFNL